MTSIETRPQARKEFDPRKQDHGDAAQRRGHENYGYWDQRWQERGSVNTDKTYLKEVIRDGFIDYEHMSREQLEAEADRILQEAADEETATTNEADTRIHTIAEAGGRTDKEIRDSMARAATLDAYEHDDFGDYNGDLHIRISNRPR